jgi:hypothetical protein
MGARHLPIAWRSHCASLLSRRLRLFSGFWGQVKIAAVEIDRVNEVLFAPKGAELLCESGASPLGGLAIKRVAVVAPWLVAELLSVQQPAKYLGPLSEAQLTDLVKNQVQASTSNFSLVC